MSNILKGILNEISPHNYDSDWDYQDAVARSGKSRSSYRSQEDDDTFDADVAYSKKMYQLGQQQKAAKEKAQRDSDHDRLATGTNEGVRDLGYNAQSLIMKLRRDVEEKRLQPTRQAILAAARELAGDMNFAPELLVQQVLGKGVAEGLDDPWGDQGNFAGDKPVNLGNVSMKNIQTGDTVKYLGQPSKVVAMSKDRKHSRITISKGMGTVTQDVLTSDLQQLGRGTTIEENDNIQTRMRMDDYYKLADAIQEKLRQAIKLGDNELVHKLSKERADLDTRVKKYGLIPESQLDELSNEKLAQYKTAAALDAGKADKEGDYKRGDKRFSGIVKATKKQFANDTKKSGISQGINEFAPIKPPTAGAFGGNKDYGQPNSSRYIGGNKFVVGTTNNYVLTATIDKWGLEWDEDDEIWFLDSPGAAHIADASEGEIELPPPREQRNQIHDLVTDYLNARNSADLQKVAAYYGHSDDGEMATNEGIEAPRFNSKQEVINHFVKNGKSAAAGASAWERGWRGSSPKRPIELKKPPQRSYHDDLDDKRYSSVDENLGDQLKSTSLDALIQAKLAIEKNREAEIEAWKQDFEKNTVQKAQQELNKGFQPTPVAQPGEKHSVLKARLAQLNNAIQKQELLDKLVDRLERKGLLTPAMQNDTDTRMHVRYGAKDNYESLNKKLDNAIQTLQNRLNVRKISGLKEVHDERDEYDNPRQGRDYGKGNLFVDPGSNEFKKEVHPSDPNVERGRPKNLKGVSKALPADAFGRTTGKIPDSARPTSKEDPFKDVDEDLDENLHKWFQEKWVRFGPDGKIRGDCARGDDSEGKPKCLPQSKAQNLGKKGRASAAARKRREDPNPERSGKAINVNTKKTNEEQLDELSCWSGYHRVAGTKAGFPGSCAKNKTNESNHSETCPHCGGEMVSEELMNEKKDACYYKVKSRYKVWPSAYASGALVKCRKSGADSWGNGGKKNESIEEGWQDEAQELEDWSKEVNEKLYRAHETQRPGLARQLSKLEQKHFGSSLNQGSLTEIVKAALMALQKGQMVHYDPQRVGQMPFGNIVGDDAKIIAQYNITREELAGYRMLHDKGMVDNLDQFLKLRRLVRAKSWPLEYYEELEKLTPEEAWLKMADDLNWSKDNMSEEVQSKTDDKLLAYYAQRKAEKQKQQSQPQDQLDEKWTKKYKDSINCSNPKGFSQKAHCAGKQKNESAIMKGLNQIDEDWKKRFGAAALTGAMALGSAGAQARVTPDGQGGFTGGLKPAATATDGLVHADSADRQAQTITVGGKEYGLVEISPTDIRPRSGQRIVVPQAVLGERGIGNYMGILVGNRVFVISK